MRTRFTKQLNETERFEWPAQLRLFVPERDTSAVVEAFADAYLDTHDYRDCTPRQVRADAEVEVEMTVAGQVGEWLPEASLVYEAGDLVLGGLFVVSWHGGPWLRSLFVRRGWRRVGVASVLMGAGVETLRRLGHDHLSTFVSEGNRPAVGFLTAHGFSQNQEAAWTSAH